MTPAIVWFRQDLRLRDNPALAAAVARGGPVIPVYIDDPDGEGAWKRGAASRWWLHHSLVSLDAALRSKASRLVVARGPAAEVLRGLVARAGARPVYWNRRYEPAAVAVEAAVEAALAGSGCETQRFNSALLFEPGTVTNRQGRPFQVFSPFWRHSLQLPVPEPTRGVAGALRPPPRWPLSLKIDGLGLRPRKHGDAGLAATWEPGEAGAARRLKHFVGNAIGRYDSARDLPGETGTSMLSPHLHFGELGPRQVWRAVKSLSKETGIFPLGKGERVFLSEIGWREFAHHLLFHFPETPTSPLRPEFRRFPWRPDPRGTRLKAWQRGLTGYPIVDAGMRQLWHTGWMHNRVRMIVASFLVKHLGLPWNEGAAWFWDTLVDADLANNTLGWQWSAGCGADAAPFFRIFAPVRQGQRFDPDGTYVRHWVPELSGLPVAYLHRPWEAPVEVLAAANVRLGATYPGPCVDHARARAAALEGFRQMRVSHLA